MLATSVATQPPPRSGEAIFNTIYDLAKTLQIQALEQFLMQEQLSIDFTYKFSTVPKKLAQEGYWQSVNVLMKLFFASKDDIIEGLAAGGFEEKVEKLLKQNASLARAIRGYAASSHAAKLISLKSAHGVEYGKELTDCARAELAGYAKAGWTLDKMLAEPSFADMLLEPQYSHQQNRWACNLVRAETASTLFLQLQKGYAEADDLTNATLLSQIVVSRCPKKYVDWYRAWLQEKIKIAKVSAFAQAGFHQNELIEEAHENEEGVIAELTTALIKGQLDGGHIFATDYSNSTPGHNGALSCHITDIKLLTAMLARLDFHIIDSLPTRQLIQICALFPAFKKRYLSIETTNVMSNTIKQLMQYSTSHRIPINFISYWDTVLTTLLYQRISLQENREPLPAIYLLTILEYYTGLPSTHISVMIRQHQAMLESSTSLQLELKTKLLKGITFFSAETALSITKNTVATLK